MKFGFTPLECKQVIFKDDEELYKSVGMEFYQDILDEQYGEWYRIYSDMLIMPTLAIELFRVGQKCWRLEDGEHFVRLGKMEWATVISKNETRDYTYLQLKDGTELYHY